MELKEKITLDMLTQDSVIVLRQKFINLGGEDVQVGENVRNAYTNCESDREILRKQLSEEYFNAVIAVWGNQENRSSDSEVNLIKYDSTHFRSGNKARKRKIFCLEVKSLVNLFKGCGCGQRPQKLYANANFRQPNGLPFSGLNIMA